MALKKKDYKENGVSLSKKALNVGDEFSILYDGILSQHGAEEVFAHVGYGENWENAETLKMNKENGSFTAKIVAQKEGTLNLCFKDAIDNWDNNSAENYTFEIKESASKKITEVKKETKATKTTKAVKEQDVALDEKTQKTEKTTKVAKKVESKPVVTEQEKTTVKKARAKKV